MRVHCAMLVLTAKTRLIVMVALAGAQCLLKSSAGEVENSLDLGIYVYKKASIGNFVWYDNDHDGIQDAGELGVPVSVQLLDSVGSVVATTATDVNGFYQFTDFNRYL